MEAAIRCGKGSGCGAGAGLLSSSELIAFFDTQDRESYVEQRAVAMKRYKDAESKWQVAKLDEFAKLGKPVLKKRAREFEEKVKADEKQAEIVAAEKEKKKKRGRPEAALKAIGEKGRNKAAEVEVEPAAEEPEVTEGRRGRKPRK